MSGSLLGKLTSCAGRGGGEAQGQHCWGEGERRRQRFGNYRGHFPTWPCVMLPVTPCLSEGRHHCPNFSNILSQRCQGWYVWFYPRYLHLLCHFDQVSLYNWSSENLSQKMQPSRHDQGMNPPTAQRLCAEFPSWLPIACSGDAPFHLHVEIAKVKMHFPSVSLAKGQRLQPPKLPKSCIINLVGLIDLISLAGKFFNIHRIHIQSECMLDQYINLIKRWFGVF